VKPSTRAVICLGSAEQLTVSKNGKLTRIAAGRYTVEIDGAFDGMNVQQGVVLLKRGETATVTITQNHQSRTKEISYNVNDLLTLDADSSVESQLEVLVDLIRITVEPESWDKNTASIEPHPGNVSLIIRQTNSVQKAIDRLLKALRELGAELPAANGQTSVRSFPSPTGDYRLTKPANLISETPISKWNDVVELTAETGIALVMFGDGTENSKRMLPVARRVAEAASAQFVDLTQVNCRKIIPSNAPHFVLMKDQQVVGARTGLLTENRLRALFDIAGHWLTPRATGVDESCLVRIDCYINPGRDNIGSQHGGAFPLTTAVVAVHEDEALLLGPDSIAGYIDDGYACLANVIDASGNRTHVPLDIVHIGPVPLIRGPIEKKRPPASISITDNEGRSVELPFEIKGYPASFTNPLDAYETGMAVYQIRGVHGLNSVRLADANYVSQVNDHVLSVGFRRDRLAPPFHNITSPMHWQSQSVKQVGVSIYGGNLNGPNLTTIQCPTRPAPLGFTFTEDGRLLGEYALGMPSDDDMTFTVHQSATIHSVLRVALRKIENESAKASLESTVLGTKATVDGSRPNLP